MLQGQNPVHQRRRHPGVGGFCAGRAGLRTVEDHRDADPIQDSQQHRLGLILNLRTHQFSLVNLQTMLRSGSVRWTTTYSCWAGLTQCRSPMWGHYYKALHNYGSNENAVLGADQQTGRSWLMHSVVGSGMIQRPTKLSQQ